MQLTFLHKHFDALQRKHGEPSLNSIYGAGCSKKPRIMFVFMNPTGKNISSNKKWKGLRAPWLGTKNIWGLFKEVNILSPLSFERIRSIRPKEWTKDFAHSIYSELKTKKVFVTNLAKCTQLDARPLKNHVFKDYLELMKKEIETVNPETIISFGNQVNSILLEKPVLVSTYKDTKYELLHIHNKTFKVFPAYYPLGQGRRNLPKAIQRIKTILTSS